MKSNKPTSFVNEIFYPRTEVLNEILDKWKTYGDKRCLVYINKNETPSNGETMFVKGKDEIPNQVASFKNPSLHRLQENKAHSI